MKYRHFEDWFYEIENYGTRGERFLESTDSFKPTRKETNELVRWLRAAFDSARIEEKPNVAYSEQYDAYYDADKNEWIEAKCQDASCSYCNSRPDRPINTDANVYHVEEITKFDRPPNNYGQH